MTTASMELQESKPLVSIIMPCYNAGIFVKEAIFSILNQTWQNIELLICDDASTDETRSIMESFNDHRIRKFYHQENLGYLATCNELFQKVSGDFVSFQDADDFSEPGRIAQCLEAFRMNPEIGFVITDFRRISKSGRSLSSIIEPVDLERFRLDSNYKIRVCGATIFIRREVLNKVGFYHPFFERKGGEDYEWLFRISRNFKGEHIREPLYVYRMYDSQVKLYNMRHKNIDFFIILPAIEFIRKVWIEKNMYLLEEENQFWLQEKIKQLEQPFKEDSSKFYRYTSIEFLNLYDFKRAFQMSFWGLRNKPGKPINFVFPVYILYLIFRRKVPFQLIPENYRERWKKKERF
ncbi:MAG: glycosyltransferase [Bacteroidia bacterium]|nr:glycosyltransferase [Bacteroidia bacterium]